MCAGCVLTCLVDYSSLGARRALALACTLSLARFTLRYPVIRTSSHRQQYNEDKRAHNKLFRPHFHLHNNSQHLNSNAPHSHAPPKYLRWYDASTLTDASGLRGKSRCRQRSRLELDNDSLVVLMGHLRLRWTSESLPLPNARSQRTTNYSSNSTVAVLHGVLTSIFTSGCSCRLF